VIKGINTNSKEWCDLVFEGKNKSYGAYRMRRTSAKRHILSFIFTILFFLFFASIPSIVERIQFYIFQNTDMDYVVEDYNYITENLTELELMALSKQFIPNPAKKSQKEEPMEQSTRDLRTIIPIIVDDALLDESYLEDLQKDTTVEEVKKEEPMEETETKQDEGLFVIVEEMPSFPGGETGLMEFIYKNLRYPSIAKDSILQKTVICTFIVDTKGFVTRAEVVQSAHPILDKEALRIIYSLPKWQPAKQHGKPVRVKFTLPIIFRLK